MSEAIYQQAIADLERPGLGAALQADAIALVPTIPTRQEGMPYCRMCESVLCGACGLCHSLDCLSEGLVCPDDGDTMGHDCAAWFQAYLAVYTAVYSAARQQGETEQ